MPMQSSDYSVAEAFRRIERELIDSMIKNMKRHLEWENDEGFQWEMWQALQLQALEKYRQENPDKFRGAFEDVNAQIAEIIEEARQNGQLDQEVEILDAIQKGWKPPALDEGLSGMFFRINDRKMDALISATTHDFEKAEAAILRKANDNYRKVIFSAQMYANSGAATYEKAVDMATKDFLAAGINCIEYKDGSRHTLQDYCDMALRTAQKRAYLAGEGEKRAEWGIHTVIMNKRGQGQPCPLCLPFVGKILIDDVYGGGKKEDGPYKLLSEAMAAGLYHPRCRDSHTAYFPEVTEVEKLTKEDVERTKEDYMTEQKANYCSRQEEKYGRLEEFSLDPENKRKYGARRKEWADRSEQLQMEIGAKEETNQTETRQRLLFNGIARRQKNRSEQKLVAVATNLKEQLSNYVFRDSKWSGRIRVVSRMEKKEYLAEKLWNCDIITTTRVSDSTLLHELLHSTSASWVDKKEYAGYAAIEEASTQLLTEEICKVEGIAFQRTYFAETKVLRTFCDYLGYSTHLDFARELYKQPLKDRYNWLESKVIHKLRMENRSVQDRQSAIGYLQTISGGI